MHKTHIGVVPLLIVQAQHFAIYKSTQRTTQSTANERPATKDRTTMAHATDIRIAQGGFGEWVRQSVELARHQLARRKLYKTTVRELRALSGRELVDLGINRSMIRRLALEAAYGEPK